MSLSALLRMTAQQDVLAAVTLLCLLLPGIY
jgi:hypothetical protein